ncbi:UDP-glucose 4-epimerase [Metarhizium album ARSEF 1941]|uniref:UDP-glucose 4-epimerase n=1 Tax=Metarhizium album (strain ARSEF 1941) TaxID=1081103 RepID=A0A0B2WIZ9_METAS|nr:UDP-glucose 4-epimerase [Metarhizium album ARSEF 1941]KHN93823.1 UDP-glucose 4-epimerase [Metarhizium album ARSEF 1941]
MPALSRPDSLTWSGQSSLNSSRPTTPDGESEGGYALPLSLDFENVVLVIGGLGFIGSHTALELLKAGYNVSIVDDLSNSFKVAFGRIKELALKHHSSRGTKMPSLQLHMLDYRSRGMRDVLDLYSVPSQKSTAAAVPHNARRSRISGVIHFAAFKSVSESISRPVQYYQNNVCGLVDLVSLLGEHNIRNLVFSSSATVYGCKADLGRPLREEDLVHPEAYVDDNGLEITPESFASLQSPYARTKFFCEAILADVARSDSSWRITCLRYFNPIGCDASGLLGEDPKGTPTNLFPVITQVLAGARKELDVFGSDWDTRDGTPVRDYVHVSDVARGHVAALATEAKEPFRTYNLGSGTGTTVAEAVRSLERASKRSIPVRLADRREGDVGSCVASNERAFRELGWEARESVSQCAEDLWNFVSKVQAPGTLQPERKAASPV